MSFDIDYYSLDVSWGKRKGDDGSAEIKALYAAIIDQAIRDYLAYKNPKNKNKKSVVRRGEEAEVWLFYETPNNLPDLYNFENEKEMRLAKFTCFENLCQILGWSSEWIRQKIWELEDSGQFYKLGRRRGCVFEPGEDDFEL